MYDFDYLKDGIFNLISDDPDQYDIDPDIPVADQYTLDSFSTDQNGRPYCHIKFANDPTWYTATDYGKEIRIEN